MHEIVVNRNLTVSMFACSIIISVVLRNVLAVSEILFS